MTLQTPRFAMLADLAKETTSEGRRELLRKVTEAFDPAVPLAGDEVAQFDDVLASVAADYSKQVRSQIARLIASSLAPFSRSAQRFAMDDIEVARPVLEHSEALSDDTLIAVVGQKSQDHMMAVTRRRRISEAVSQALVEQGNDAVGTPLLSNQKAEIGSETYGLVAKRAETSPVLQAPLVRRAGVPMELLNGLYMKVEADLRREIIGKFESVPPEELEAAFQRSRTRVSNLYKQPDDFESARRRIDDLQRKGALIPPVLVTLMREGLSGRTAFKIAFARLTDVEYDVIERVIETQDLDTVALLCRGSQFDRALYVSLAVALGDRAMDGAQEFGRLYESVPIQAAQRAIRFWKIRAAA